jgi:hypothetical protein
MNVLFTIAILAAAAMWAMTVLTRLSRLREQVKQAWKRLEADRSSEAVRNVYNRHVDLYNAALDGFPASIIGPAAGFKVAKRFNLTT